VETHVDGAELEPGLVRALIAYSDKLEPWARRQSKKMLETVAKSNRKAYVNKARITKQSKEIGKILNSSLSESGVDRVAGALMNEQVELIKSLPLRAATRAQRLAQTAVMEGTRASEIAEELARSGEVSESSAALIARTEVARANASITQARAAALGAEAYIWRTTMDGAERDSHAKMNGKFVKYSEEPKLSDGTVGHAGTFPNCRCYQDVQFED